MTSLEKLENLRGQFEEESNNPIAVICDYLIEKAKREIVVFNESIDETEQ